MTTPTGRPALATVALREICPEVPTAHGTLGAGVVLLMWFWFSALSNVLGAELNEVLLVRSAGATNAG